MRTHLSNAALILLSVGAAALFCWYINSGKTKVYRVPCSSNTGFCYEYHR